MRYIIIGIALKLLITSVAAFSQDVNKKKDYKKYHEGIIQAETQFFLYKEPLKGLEVFSKTFKQYDFVYVNDCIEAFQLALYLKREDYAMYFIKKAIENGFQIDYLKYLRCGCPCNFYQGIKNNVTIFDDFLKKNKHSLADYTTNCLSHYLTRIDKSSFVQVIKRHVTDQLYKDYHKNLIISDNEKMSMSLQQQEYLKIIEQNNLFIDSLAISGIFLGELNLGIYSNQLVDHLGLNVSTKNHKKNLLKYNQLPQNTYVSIVTDEDYFNISPLYNMLYHNRSSFAQLTRYKDTAIMLGYLHPREYASLKFAGHSVADSDQLYLTPSVKKISNVARVNNLRAKYLLPSYEIDSCKHVFAHEHNLKLQFGYFNGTR